MPPDAEPAIKVAIARGLADVRESKVTPHPAVARLVTAAPVADEGAPAARAVVWSEAARDVLVPRVQGLATDDPQAAAAFAGAGRSGGAGARPGRVRRRWPLAAHLRKDRAGASAVLAFELVTWTKAGEVIAILHLFDAPPPPGPRSRRAALALTAPRYEPRLAISWFETRLAALLTMRLAEGTRDEPRRLKDSCRA